jgi:hypothetical protein
VFNPIQTTILSYYVLKYVFIFKCNASCVCTVPKKIITVCLTRVTHLVIFVVRL